MLLPPTVGFFVEVVSLEFISEILEPGRLDACPCLAAIFVSRAPIRMRETPHLQPRYKAIDPMKSYNFHTENISI
jgi:hypothetical protein